MVRTPSFLILAGLSIACLPSLAATFQEVIRGRGELSAIVAVAERFPSVLGNFTTEGGTLLAPTNDALFRFLATFGIRDLASVTEATARDLVAYHILPRSLFSANLTVQGGVVANTHLNSTTYANLGGAPNVVFASAFGSTGQFQSQGSLKIYSGVGPTSNVTVVDLQFDNGYVQIIDRVLNLPQTPSKTVEAAQLSTLLQAAQKANKTDLVDTTANLTLFAPTDDAFREAGIDINSLSTEQLTDILRYHAIAGAVGYSTVLEDGKEYQTLLGSYVTVYKRDGQLLVNEAEVVVGNVITTSGVAHIINAVLSPPSVSTTSTAPDSAATSVGPTSDSSTGTGGTSSGSSTSSAPCFVAAGALVSAVVALASGILLF